MLARLDHNDSTTDEFQISRSGTTNVFYAYFNGNRVTTANVQFWNSRGFQLGGELTTAVGTSNTFNMYARALDASGTRHLLTNPQTAYNNKTAVLTGSHPSDSAWTWRIKP